MKRKALVLAVLFILSTIICGCVVKTETSTCEMSREEKIEFAEMVAEKVVELQEQQKDASNP